MGSREIFERFRKRSTELHVLRETYEETKVWAEAVSPSYRKGDECYGHSRAWRPADRTGNGAVSLDEICAKMNEKLCGISEELAVAYELIDLADDPLDRAILYAHYLNGQSWLLVSIHVHLSRDQVKRRARAACMEIDRKMTLHTPPF